MDQGLVLPAGGLIVVYGSKGLDPGAEAAFRSPMLTQRSQRHEQANVAAPLPREELQDWRGHRVTAYQRPI